MRTGRHYEISFLLDLMCLFCVSLKVDLIFGINMNNRWMTDISQVLSFPHFNHIVMKIMNEATVTAIIANYI